MDLSSILYIKTHIRPLYYNGLVNFIRNYKYLLYTFITTDREPTTYYYSFLCKGSLGGPFANLQKTFLDKKMSLVVLYSH